MTQLKLIAFDAEDMNVISAHLQDAIVRVGDMAFLPHEKRFAAVLSRFDWTRVLGHDGEPANGRRDLARLRTALRFERVLAARTTGIDLGRPHDVLALLAVAYEGWNADDPSGTVTLTFSGRSAVQLDVECLEAELKDLGPGWSASTCPVHPLDDGTDRSPSD